ncbi:MAG: ATP-dependent Clp protease ATP-binding subunit [Tenericutes bacterium]|nr:ATP-dependent Clp protease ATP-binding subunit [Mycoplasmatota bacterium]
MENEKIYNELNEKTKKYLKVVLSYMDSIDDQTENKTSSLPIAAFLAILHEKSFIKDFFNSKGITYEKCVEYFNPNKNFEIKDINQTKFYQKSDLSNVLITILDNFKYDYYLEDCDFFLNDLEPYHLFDYISMSNYETIENMLLSQFGIKDFYKSDIYDEYQTIVGIKCSELAEEFGVDLEEKMQEEEFEEYNLNNFNIVFDGETVFLYLNKNISNISVPIQNNNIKEIKFGPYTQITKINGEEINEKVFENFISSFDNSVFCQFTILEDNGKEFTFTAYKEDMFGTVLINNENASYNTNLKKYGDDLTEAAYIKDPAVGREKEIRRIEQILLYPEKDKSIIITGDAGCGKTALVKGLAYRVQKGNVPTPLKNLKIISIDTTTIVAGTKYVGTIEEKMLGILKEASKDKNIVLFIDEIHQAISGGKSEGDNNTVAEILKPYLDGKVRIIGATTNEEYAEYIEPNTAFKTRLKKIAIKEPTNEVIYEIIDDLINAYNKISFSKFLFDEENKKHIINWLIESTKNTSRVYNDRASNPRLVLDILKEAYAIAALNDKEEIEIKDICEALMNEDRIYESKRNSQSELLKTYVNKDREEHRPKGIILEFKKRTN